MSKTKIQKFLNVFILCLFLFNTNDSFGQKFTLNELISLNKKSYPNFKNYVMNKGYNFFKTENSKDGNTFKFGYNVDYSNNMSNYWIEYTNYKDSTFPIKSSISWQTRNKRDYLAMIKEIKSNNFKYVGIEMEEKLVVTTYVKGNIIINLFQKHILDNIGAYSLTYEIGVNIKRVL